jgi:hypothetical protein
MSKTVVVPQYIIDSNTFRCKGKVVFDLDNVQMCQFVQSTYTKKSLVVIKLLGWRIVLPFVWIKKQERCDHYVVRVGKGKIVGSESCVIKTVVDPYCNANNGMAFYR